MSEFTITKASLEQGYICIRLININRCDEIFTSWLWFVPPLKLTYLLLKLRWQCCECRSIWFESLRFLYKKKPVTFSIRELCEGIRIKLELMNTVNCSWITIAPLSIHAKDQFLNHFYVVISVLKEQFYINNCSY